MVVSKTGYQAVKARHTCIRRLSAWPLTDVAVRNAKPGPKNIRLKDERGLHLEISPKGGKWWRLRYWISGKERLISLGTYPDISLKDARERRDEARKLIANG